MFRNQKNTKPAPTGDAVAPVTFRSEHIAHKLQDHARVSEKHANEAYGKAQHAYGEAQNARNALNDLSVAEQGLKTKLGEIEQKRAEAVHTERAKRAEGDRHMADHAECLAQRDDALMLLNLAGVTTDTFPTPNGAQPDAAQPDDGFARFTTAHDEDDGRAGGE